ncbi:uncharacterized protein LY89DRAFT_159282 [Mollisia scopiformis]|uniref:Zn(2)-C6 fungal-type domain-containing protein n=1 Tax=Mollisia scopiformis TaxID=149040 RepID=A0A194WZZ9_MOLSC|nr:uncharacterized protein LY89DRAFT_159282 [Mollisia scopiformis]KUJ13523.1 hypothetical protein LY89DRAFT_159282 [Mollisia scopiformis]
MDSSSASSSTSKRSRTSGKHSRNGCGTCKIRRVKCDETRPICRRCQNFKIPCDGYSRLPKTSTPGSTVSGGLLIAPKPVTPAIVPSSIPPSPSTLVVDNAEDYRYFTFFRDQLLFEITQFAQGDDFRRLILQASNIPSIRHTMVALAALGKIHSVIQDTPSSSLPLSEPTELISHREYSLRQYSKGLALMKKDVATGHQGIRTTLLTSLLIICIECLHGNFTMAGVQVANGMALLRDWRRNYPDADLHPIGFSSPAPNVVEDSLVQMLGGLEIQSYYFNSNATQAEHEAGKEDGFNVIQNMPARFESVDEARLYLELLTRRSKHWLFSLGWFFRPLIPVEGVAPVDTTLPPSARQPRQFLNLTPSMMHPASVHRRETIPDSSKDLVKKHHDQYLRDFFRWKASFDALLQTPSSKSISPRWKENLLIYKGCVLILKTVITGDEMVFDDYTEEMVEILDLAEDVYESDKDHRNDTTFTIFQRCTGPPHFVGLHCRVGAVRRRAIQLLESLPKTPDLSDTMLRSAIVKWVMGLEEAEMVDGKIPGYARIRNVGISVDVDNRQSTLVCKHQVMREEGLVETERKKTINC